ncbi:MAG TPA: cobalt ECF transporter T component CbiQ [Dissulfurispiraceae bacterium]|nr:cobalt ECF transporter T component CbiQ [Dissulfurispiraceae bacterium]
MHQWTIPVMPHHMLSRIDTRVRLFCAVFAIGLAIGQSGMLFPALIFLASSAAVFAIGIRMRYYLMRLVEPLMIGLVLITIKSLSGNEGFATWQVGAWRVEIFQDGMVAGCAIALRIAASVSVMLLLAFSCTFTDLLTALSWFRMPRGMIEILLFAYQSLTALQEEASTIYHAQRNRLGYTSTRQGLRSFGVLAGTLTLRAFDRSQTTALAMMQRGYDGHLPRGDSRKLSMHDFCTVLLFLAGMGALWIMTSGI